MKLQSKLHLHFVKTISIILPIKNATGASGTGGKPKLIKPDTYTPHAGKRLTRTSRTLIPRLRQAEWVRYRYIFNWPPRDTTHRNGHAQYQTTGIRAPI